MGKHMFRMQLNTLVLYQAEKKKTEVKDRQEEECLGFT